MVDRADMPLALQVAFPEAFGLTWAARFMGSLLELLGENGVIGPCMARALTEWRWPPLLPVSDLSWRWLYIAMQAPDGIVKIGLSATPFKRMKSLPSDYGDGGRFEIVAVVPRCGLEHERAVCRLFVDSRLRGDEWFRNTIATRILCWNAAEQRNRTAHDEKWKVIAERLADGFAALGWLCGGPIPGAKAWELKRRRELEAKRPARAARARKGWANRVARLAAKGAA